MKQLVGFIFLWILLLIGCTTERQRTAMQQGLDSLNQCNRTDQPFTTKDVEPYVRFFDSHGFCTFADKYGYLEEIHYML
ncbi:MAG: hypothetical protein IKN19_09180 [Bacteroidaceae bacterium]|nr:hypothetical protein [Bacteroidaceae bacterium]